MDMLHGMSSCLKSMNKATQSKIKYHPDHINVTKYGLFSAQCGDLLAVALRNRQIIYENKS